MIHSFIYLYISNIFKLLILLSQKSTLRSYHSKVMSLPDQPIKYHSNISSLYSNDNNKCIIPNISEQDIEDVSKK